MVYLSLLQIPLMLTMTLFCPKSRTQLLASQGVLHNISVVLTSTSRDQRLIPLSSMEVTCGSDLNGRHATDNTGLDESTVPPSLTRITRIRFRSRVRITSGLSRLRQGRTNTLPSTDIDTGYFCYTPSSSGSRSSSISAPLRSRTDDEAGRPGWGPLGRRVSMLAKKNRMKKRFKLSKDDQPWTPPQSNKVNGSEASWDRGEATEASPLLVSHPHRGSGSRSCRRRQGGRCCCIECGLSSHKKPSSDEVDEVFSKWPSRMLNYQVLFSFRIYALAVSLRWH